ncbi:uncharacterized protein LAESUDRAFT_714862 [Laetiporus sulphureus 93-53]|uniref:DLIC-domain-containing protein n=1 Tax=Laetiporus sulphureus 93-53 TaxID=1314785 RepID=A0A165DU54_9APHY|nr:uncharacterized protein LAESUDRAFT_714862 [Laetiporus sulphureus 93-53]KZT05638.1 hypothetical protein LAESUDRAFT_714862 [Laetiporus sulphureus 93-53]
MDNSEPLPMETPPQDLWSSILDSVSTSRSIPAKQVLVLGQPSSGKSTLVSALLHKPLIESEKKDERTDFALGYDWADVRDDADEVYTVPSSAPSYTALLSHFLPPRTSLPHSVVIIVLDWTRPWAFVEELETWLEWIEQWSKGDGSRELEIVREENRERLQAHLQHYVEPTAEPLPATSTMSGTVLPLGPGTLTHNSTGVPVIVACTKADLIDENNNILGTGASGMGGMVKGKGGEWEERTDGVMQVLRTICLKYGAGLFYTSLLPDTLQILRQYALHLVFMPPAPSPGISSPIEPTAPVRNPFPFQHKPNALDRDRIVIPAGWDSWGKIGVLRDNFDPRFWNEAWERDLEHTEEENQPGAKKMYSVLVPDQGAKAPPLPPFNNPIPEQTFLAKNYDENSKKPDRDPRGAFRNPSENAGAGVVGPMGSSSFSMPHVERALTEMEGGAIAGAPNLASASSSGEATRKTSGRSSGRTSSSTLTAPLASLASRSAASSPAVASPGAGGQTQHEVLQNFFQSLLSSNKGSANAGAAASRAGNVPTKANGSVNGPDTEKAQ